MSDPKLPNPCPVCGAFLWDDPRHSGENPRLLIGTCETLADIQRTHEAIRLINSYKQPDDFGAAAPAQEPTP